MSFSDAEETKNILINKMVERDQQLWNMYLVPGGDINLMKAEMTGIAITI